MNRAQTIVKTMASAAALFAVCAIAGPSQQALAQEGDPGNIVVTRSSGPFLAAGGESILVCAANNTAVANPAPTTAAAVPAISTTPLNVTLKILNGVTGQVVAQTQISLSPLGSTEEPPDPCLTFTVAPSTFAPSTNLFVVRVALNPQPLPPGLCAPHALSVSTQIFTPDMSGNPTNIRAVAFQPPDPCDRSQFFALSTLGPGGRMH